MKVVMKLLFLLLIGASMTVPAQKKAAHSQNSVDLQIRLEVLSEIYCPVKEFGLKLKLTFANLGTKNIILSRDAPQILNWSVSRVSGRKERRIMETLKSPPEIKTYQGNRNAPDPEYFIILKPGESYELRNVPYGYKFLTGLEDGRYRLNYQMIAPYTPDMKNLDWEKLRSFRGGYL